MKQIKNVLYIINDNILNLQGDTILIKDLNDNHYKIPIINIEEIVIFGNITISSPLIKFCSDNNIVVSFVSEYGNFMGRFYGKTSGNVILRKRQYDIYNTEKRIIVARNVVLGKCLNQINTIQQYIYDSTDDTKKENLYQALKKMKCEFPKIDTLNDIKSIMGIEGKIAEIYFSVFDDMIKIDNPEMRFEKRSRKPPENNCNAMLSLLYTLFSLNCVSALETFGLDSSLGYLHEIRPGRSSLALDLVEEFRTPIVDKFIITLINRKQITSKNFENKGQGIKFKANDLKKFLQLWEDYKNTEIEYKLYNIKTPIKTIPYFQSQLLAQFIRGDIEEYPPFVM